MFFGNGYDYCRDRMQRSARRSLGLPPRRLVGLYATNPRHLRHLMETSSMRVSLSSASQPYRRRSYSPVMRGRRRSRGSGAGLIKRFVHYTFIAVCVLIILGFVSTVVGGLYLGRIVAPGNDGHVDDVNQLLCILAIICGMIMLLSSSVLLRALLCKRSGSCLAGPHVGGPSSCAPDSGRRSAASLASHNNNTDLHSAPHPSSEDSDSPVGLPSPLFMPSLPACPPPYMPTADPLMAGAGLHCVQRDHVTGMILPPKYSAEPPPSYSVLELERLGLEPALVGGASGRPAGEADVEAAEEAEAVENGPEDKPVSIWTRQGSV